MAIGFRTFGEWINEDKIVPGGEESAGMSFKGYNPKKDGILAYLLAAEAVTARGELKRTEQTALHERLSRLESESDLNLEELLEHGCKYILG